MKSRAADILHPGKEEHMRHKILLVDDQENVLLGLQREPRWEQRLP